jgi:hypothetical protein
MYKQQSRGHYGSAGIELMLAWLRAVLLCWLCSFTCSYFFLKYSSDKKP